MEARPDVRVTQGAWPATFRNTVRFAKVNNFLAKIISHTGGGYGPL